MKSYKTSKFNSNQHFRWYVCGGLERKRTSAQYEAIVELKTQNQDPDDSDS